MKKYQWTLILASVSLIAFSGCKTVDINKQIAQQRDALDKQEQWRYDLPKTESEPLRPVFPKAVKGKLKNGLEFYVVEDHRLPIAEVSLVMKGGSASDPVGSAGLNHVTNLMLKEGTKKMTGLELAEAFANLGTEARFGVTKDFSSIAVSVMSTKVDDVIPLFADMVKEPRLNADDFARVKLQHQSMVASQQGILAYVAQTNFLAAAYGEKHPYGSPSAGTLASVSKLEVADIKKAHSTNFGANNAALIVIGDVTLAQVKALAKKHFASWKKARPATPSLTIAPSKQMQTRLVARSNSPQTFLVIGQPAASATDNDLATIEVFQSIIAGYPHSRLDANLREKKGWTYGVGSSVSPLRGKGPMMVSTSIQVPYGADAINEILQEFDRLKSEPVTDAELASAKNGLLHSFAGRYSTLSKILLTVINQFVYTLPANAEEVHYDKVAKVTKEDIIKVAKRTLAKNQLVAVAVGDLETMEAPLSKMNVGKITIERESSPTTK